MAKKTSSGTTALTAGVQAYSTTTGYLGNYIVEWYVSTNYDTTIACQTSSDGASSWSSVGDTEAVKNDTIYFFRYGTGYQRLALLLEEGSSDTASWGYTAYQPYITPTEVRNHLKMQEVEYTDEQLLQIIHEAMGELHERVGRVWWGVETVTSQELTTIGGDTHITLPKVDIQSITAFSIDDDNDGTYTDITVSSIRWNENGVVQLSDDSEVSEFPDEPSRVKASYTYGNDKPTGEVRRLTMMMVENLLSNDSDLSRQIDVKVNKLVASNYIMV